MELVHTLNRGVDKRKIFMDEKDYVRFIHDLYEFNDENWVSNVLYRSVKSMDIASPYIKKPRELLVDIHAFCLMPNHYHLLLSPLVEDGISKFMKKLNMGYAKYFNEKYERSGALFEGRYKRIPVEKEAHFIHLPFYIHFNPLDLFMPEWRDGTIKNYKKAVNFLENYRWSSHLDYLGKKNFPSVTNRKFLLDFFGGHAEYKKRVEERLRDMDFGILSGLTLE